MVVDLGKGYLVGTTAFIPYLMFVGNIFLFHWLNLKMRCHFLNDLFQMSCSKKVGDAKDFKHCCNCFFDTYLLEMDFLYV